MEERRLQRSGTDRMLFGVCGGLAEYFDVDATLVRLLFVLITFAGGSGILVYIILAIVVPCDRSEAREPREVLRENIAEVGSTARDIGDQIRSGFGGERGGEGEVIEGQVAGTRHRVRDRNATAGLILILVGMLFLLSNLGLLWWFRWGQLWPLILVIIGLAILWRRERR